VAQLEKWKGRLTLREVEEIFDVIDAFGLDFHRKDSLRPDQRALGVLHTSGQF
jgi:hypothetical protein